MVKSIPGIRRLGIFCDIQVFQPRSDAFCLPVPIAMRMHWKSEEDILSNPGRQVDQFGTAQLDLSGKVVNADWEDESLEAANALQANIHPDFSGHEQTRLGNSDIERVFDRSQGPNLTFP